VSCPTRTPSPRTAPGHLRCKQLLCGLGMAADTATVGYLEGLLWGRGNALLLAACFGATGAFVALLGYGPIVGIFAGVARLFGWRRREPNTSPRETTRG
jgi:hypothetical protein